MWSAAWNTVDRYRLVDRCTCGEFTLALFKRRRAVRSGCLSYHLEFTNRAGEITTTCMRPVDDYGTSALVIGACAVVSTCIAVEICMHSRIAAPAERVRARAHHSCMHSRKVRCCASYLTPRIRSSACKRLHWNPAGPGHTIHTSTVKFCRLVPT